MEEKLSSLRQNLNSITIPNHSTKIYKEECCISFDNPKSDEGIFIDLVSFLSFGKDFVSQNYEKTGHSVYLRFKKILKEEINEERPSKKPTILAVGGEDGIDNKEKEYEDKFSIVILPSFTEIHLPNLEIPEKARVAIEAVISSEGAERKQDVQTWIAEKKVSRFANNLMQVDNSKKVSGDPADWKCENCELRANLWLNLSDGSLLCGRRNFDGSGGNNHALEHYQKFKFPLSVKLGTISAELANADVYSYEEDDSVIDPYLEKHLAHFGIDFSSLQKTEQTTAERELDQNLNFDWKRIQEKGENLKPVFGPGFCGLANLGNSCYLNSVMQSVFITKDFRDRYFENLPLENAFMMSNSDLTMDLNTQMAKLAHGLLSGKYSSHENQDGICPRMFKNLIGFNHPEFSSSRQQDALEYFQHFLEIVQKNNKNYENDPSKCFRFFFEEKIECSASKCVKYTKKMDNVLSLPVCIEDAVNKEEVKAFEKKKSEKEMAGAKIDEEEIVKPIIPLHACIRAFSMADEINDFYSSAIKEKTVAYKTTRFSSFPDYLVIHLKKFVFSDGWVPKKLDVFVDVPDEIDISFLRSKGLQPDEKLLPEISEEGGSMSANTPQADEMIVSQLKDMGFPQPRCQKACIRTSNLGLEEAMNWLLEHMEDADIDEPLDAKNSKKKNVALDQTKLNTLLSFGFQKSVAEKALRENDGDVERAAEWIFSNPDAASTDLTAGMSDDVAMNDPDSSQKDAEQILPDGEGKYSLVGFVSHIGANTHSGHYVCHLKKDEKWVIFNDAKVAVSEKLPKDMGYLYFFRRIQTL